MKKWGRESVERGKNCTARGRDWIVKGEIACKEKDSVAAVKIDLIAARNNLERETQSSKKR